MNIALRGAILVVLACGGMLRGDEPEKTGREKFDAIYRLEEGEVLKRIAPPFIPERMDYYRSEHREQARAIPKGPDYFCFHWTGTLRHWGMGFIGGGGLSLSGVMQTVVGLESYDFEGDTKLLDTKLKGDWIVNPDEETAKKLEALAGIFEKATQKKIEFVQEKVQRDVLVASGDWTMDTGGGRSVVHLKSDDGDQDEGGGGGSGTMEKFFARLGDLMKTRVIDETTSTAVGSFQWRTHHSSYLERVKNPEERAEKTKKLLENVTEQTGVKFAIEKREVEIWVVRATK